MKKLWMLLIVVFLMLSMIACDTGGGGTGDEGKTAVSQKEDKEDKEDKKDKEDKEESRDDDTPGTTDGEDKDVSEALTKINAPEIEVSESGMASFLSYYGKGYRIKINGTEVERQTVWQYQLKDGDTIQVMVVGDGREYADSEWSKEAKYVAPKYDFSGLDLPESTFNSLVAYTGLEPGTYNKEMSIVCENGDFIYKKVSGSTWEYIYDADTYQVYTLIYRYSGKDNLTSDYSLVNYTEDHKDEFYRELGAHTFFSSFAWVKDDNTKVYADYNAYLAECGYTLLDQRTVGEAAEADYGKFELLDYTEYSNDINYDLFNTTYLHDSRGKKGMYDSVKDKIRMWSIERSNYYDFFKTSWLYTDYKLTLTFDESFTVEDAEKIALLLENQYGCVADEGYPFSINGGYAYRGKIAVYDYPYSESHFDYIYDSYEITYTEPMEGFSLYSTLEATYTNNEWDDAGTSHYILRDGLHKYFPRDDHGYYDIVLLNASGANSDHPLPPVKSEENFTATMQYSYSTDEPGTWRNRYTYERVGDYFVTVQEGEYSFDYAVTKKIGDRYFKRTGYLSKATEDNPNPQLEWNDFEETYELFNYEFIDNVSSYYRMYPKPVKGTDVTVAGQNCTQYTYTCDGTTYTYDVYDNSLTLKRVESYDGYTNVVEFVDYDTITALSVEVQSIVNASGINTYEPPTE